ncbi:hypothetical protein CENSYa_1284 [Cenarchaeum symbiosum A]|uniref:Uncharacterized protein n=1 Tax=Cenarchaeum symbiosum (strain A) TaxID=414004 RepID=A0RX40_CENSY|nr:hypothetical protein CENSYa_1284 [Cenarchaeum symbiosum A]
MNECASICMSQILSRPRRGTQIQDICLPIVRPYVSTSTLSAECSVCGRGPEESSLSSRTAGGESVLLCRDHDLPA